MRWKPESSEFLMPRDRQAFRVREVAGSLGVSERTVWRWISRGRLRTVREVGVTLVPAVEVSRLLCRGVTAHERDPEVDRIVREMLAGAEDR